MSEPVKDIRDEPWFKNCPEWMGEVVVRITQTSEDASRLMVEASKLMSELASRDERLIQREDLLADKQQSFINAISDLTEFASGIYGPESAFANVNRKLDQIDQRIREYTTHDERRHADIDKRFRALEERVEALERRTKIE